MTIFGLTYVWRRALKNETKQCAEMRCRVVMIIIIIIIVACVCVCVRRIDSFSSSSHNAHAVHIRSRKRFIRSQFLKYGCKRCPIIFHLMSFSFVVTVAITIVSVDDSQFSVFSTEINTSGNTTTITTTTFRETCCDCVGYRYMPCHVRTHILPPETSHRLCVLWMVYSPCSSTPFSIRQHIFPRLFRLDRLAGSNPMESNRIDTVQ